MEHENDYKRGFVPYAFAAALIGIVGGFSTVLGPAFVRDLGLAYNNTTWTALAQAVSGAACAPILGRLGDIFGRRRTLLWGIAVFTLGNILSALANSLTAMLVARFVVGVGTAAISPIILAYIAARFPREAMAKGFSLYMLISSACVVFGPTLGGLLIAACGWRAMLWVCVGICCVIFVLCLLTAKKDAERGRSLRGFDTAGAIFVLLFFGLVLCLPAFGQNLGWTSATFLGALVLAAMALFGLIAVERRATQPLLSGRFLRRRSFVLSVAALFLTQGLMQANMTDIIVFVNYTRPDDTAVSGYAISVMYLGMSLGAMLLGPLADRFAAKAVLTVSLLLTLVGCACLFLFSADTPTALLMAALAILGLGLGANGSIFMKVALSGLPAQSVGSGTGTYGLFRDLAAPFGVAVFVPMFTNRLNALSQAGLPAKNAAVCAMYALAAAEVACVAAAIVCVLFLPKIDRKGASA